MTYSQLTVHQKINAKSNSVSFYGFSHFPQSKIGLVKKLRYRDAESFYPYGLAIKDNSRFDLGWNQSYH